MLYRDYETEKQIHAQQVQKLQQLHQDAINGKEIAEMKLMEMETLIDKVCQDPNTLKSTLGETQRRLIILQVNDRKLTRLNNALTDNNQNLKKENSQLQVL